MKVFAGVLGVLLVLWHVLAGLIAVRDGLWMLAVAFHLIFPVPMSLVQDLHLELAYGSGALQGAGLLTQAALRVGVAVSALAGLVALKKGRASLALSGAVAGLLFCLVAVLIAGGMSIANVGFQDTLFTVIWEPIIGDLAWSIRPYRRFVYLAGQAVLFLVNAGVFGLLVVGARRKASA